MSSSRIFANFTRIVANICPVINSAPDWVRRNSIIPHEVPSYELHRDPAEALHEVSSRGKIRGNSCLIISVFILFFSVTLFSFAEVVDKILVIVNDEVITQSEVDGILMPIYAQYKNLYNGQALAEKLDEARRNVLQRLIQEKLLLTEAKKRKIEVKDGEVEAKIEELRRRFSTNEEFEQVMAREDIVLSELKKKYRERIMVDKLVDMEIRRKVSFTPSEVMSYYKSHAKEFKEPKRVKLLSILVKITEQRPEEEALKLAKEILSRLEEGGNFGLLAEEYSDGPYAKSGGDMGWVKEGELIDRINDLVFSLDVNGISGILRTNLGFHIFKVEEKIPLRIKEFHEVKDEIQQILFNAKVGTKLGQWIENLKKNAYIAFR